MEVVAERPMARPKKPAPAPQSVGKPSNEGKLTRLAPDVVAMGKILAASEGRHLSDYLSDLLRVELRGRYAKFMKENAPEGM